MMKTKLRIFIYTYLIFCCLACKTQLLPSEQTELTYEEYGKMQHQIATKDGKIAYLDRGEGEVILLLHGVPTSGWLYRKMVDGLVSAGYRLIIPDMLGFGNSDSPKGYDLYHPRPHAERILALMDSLNIQEWTHVFHDAGGLWTWELMSLSPKRIKNLVMLNSIVYSEGFHPPIRFKRGLSAKLTMALYSNGISTNAMLGMLFKEGLQENKMTKAGYNGYKKPLLNGQTKGMYTFFTSTCNDLPDYSHIIREINVPTLVIWGEQDDFLRIQPMKERLIQEMNLKEEQFHLIEAKHFIQEEQPELINQLMLGFLK